MPVANTFMTIWVQKLINPLKGQVVHQGLPYPMGYTKPPVEGIRSSQGVINVHFVRIIY